MIEPDHLEREPSRCFARMLAAYRQGGVRGAGAAYARAFVAAERAAEPRWNIRLLSCRPAGQGFPFGGVAVRRQWTDPVTGRRYLEEFAFEVVST